MRRFSLGFPFIYRLENTLPQILRIRFPFASLLRNTLPLLFFLLSKTHLSKFLLSIVSHRSRLLRTAVEALEEVPLPARYGFWAVPGGVAVEVVVRQATQQGRQRIETNLQEQGVPLQELYLLEDSSQLQHPIPLRGDLR